MSLQPRRRPPAATYARRTRSHPYKRPELTERRVLVEPDPSEATPELDATPSTPPPPTNKKAFSITVTATRLRTAAPRRKKPASRDGLTQLTLDLGQSLRTTCQDCGMSYHPSDTSDVSIHTRFHRKSLAGIEFSAAATTSATSSIVWRGGAAEAGAEVVAITASSSATEKRRVKEALEVVDSELGAATIEDPVLWGGRFKVFLYSVPTGSRGRRRVVGVLLVERIEEGFVAEGGEGGVRLGEKRRAVMGVCRAWTARDWRRKGVAIRLIETARKAFVYGMKVKKEEVAFSQPTESGGRLAEGWYRGPEKVRLKEKGQDLDVDTTEAAKKRDAILTEAEQPDPPATSFTSEGKGTGWLVYVERD
ncbi:ESCO1/2 acetyl-transferase-domain-containing protein [Sphaerosporella brunnea]|uniref:ESCO1/2 acetyl-transferase-domain-containing protein n=1 Tax=Sphaerosporella brunnea TaxID=1250544 RepID=A0A5J5F941_9PEZI|nr:ESCO1/2 acetyl-transferase-domain-containing protein [Sphaerosporella brunnea]